MGMQGLQFRPMQIPLNAGLQTKGDARAQHPPALDICTDAEFDDIGGLRLRKPFTTLGTAIVGGSNISLVRKIAANGSELLLWTRDSLYSYEQSIGGGGWVFRGTHLAVSRDEQAAFTTSGDQIDGDRAELSGVVVYTWADASGVWIAARDKTTGAVVAQPTLRSETTNGSRPKLRATNTRILAFWNDVALGWRFISIQPATVATDIANAATTIGDITAYDQYGDVVVVPNSDTAIFAYRRTGHTSYAVGTINATTLAVTSNTKARSVDGPVALSLAPDGSSLQVIRGNGAAIKGDLLNASTFADVYTDQAIGTAPSTPINQIAAAHRSSPDSGQFRCYAFWSYTESADTTTGWGTQSNWVDTGNTLGTAAAFIDHLGVASRAFTYNGRVFVNLGFAAASLTTAAGGATPQVTGQLQNAYYLYRDDKLLIAKACPGNGGGLAPSTAHLPNVVLTDGTATFHWCGGIRRVIPLGGNLTGYSERSPRDIAFTFDDNAARRCARIGRTLYIACGEGVLQYDGSSLVETGFHQYPWDLDLTDFAAGNMEAGTYAYKMTLRWDNAQGERDRSTTATAGTVVMGASREASIVAWWANNVTHKGVAAGTTPAAAELWRTAKNPTQDAPFYLATSSDPAATGPNHYLANDPTAMALGATQDNLADATLTVRETNPENNGVLDSLVPPPCKIIAATSDRLFLAGISGDPDRIWYSKQRNDGEVAAFNDALVVPIPHAGGDITALAFLNETLTVFRQRAIYMLPGDGYDNAGGGSNYGPARLVSSDVGAVNAESVALAPFGLVFKSDKGWYKLGRDWNVEYIGAAVAKFDSETILGVHVVDSQHQIRCLTNARILVFDYLVGEWSWFSVTTGLSACMWQGRYVVLCPVPFGGGILSGGGLGGGGGGATAAIGTNLDGPIIEATDFSSGTGYGMDIETSWIKIDDLQGRGVVRNMQVLGEYRSACKLQLRVARDYIGDGAGGWSYFDNVTPTVTPTTIGTALQVRHGPSQKRCQAMKFRITALATDGVNPPTGEAIKLTGIALDAASEGSVYNQLPVAQKA